MPPPLALTPSKRRAARTFFTREIVTASTMTSTTAAITPIAVSSRRKLPVRMRHCRREKKRWIFSASRRLTAQMISRKISQPTPPFFFFRGVWF